MTRMAFGSFMSLHLALALAASARESPASAVVASTDDPPFADDPPDRLGAPSEAPRVLTAGDAERMELARQKRARRGARR